MFKIILLSVLAITVGDRQSITAGSENVVGKNTENTVVNPEEQVINDFISAVNLSDDALNGYAPVVLKVIGVEGNKLKYVDDNESGFSYIIIPQGVKLRDFNNIIDVKTSRGVKKNFKTISIDYLKSMIPCYVGVVAKVKYLTNRRVIDDVKEIYFLIKAETDKEE